MQQERILKFLKFDIDYTIIPHKALSFTKKNKNKNNWDYYPSYQQYVDMMNLFSDSFPNICKLHNLGTLSSGRKILIIQISDNVKKKMNLHSYILLSMHGDDMISVISLRLIDYILNEYGNNQRITNLAMRLIFGLTFCKSRWSILGEIKCKLCNTSYNVNWIDLNRNYPDPENGPHPDGNLYQEETNIFIGSYRTLLIFHFLQIYMVE